MILLISLAAALSPALSMGGTAARKKKAVYPLVRGAAARRADIYRAGGTVFKLLPPKVTRFLEKTESSKLEMLIKRAGAAGPSAEEVLGAQMIGAGAGLIAGAWLAGPSRLFALVGPGLAYCGWRLTIAPLSARAAARREEIIGCMPDFIDLMAVCLEAGLNLEGGLRAYCARFDNPLSEIFSRALGEIALGRPRAAALSRLADENRIEIIDSFVQAVLQSERLGTPLAAALASQAGAARRRQRALFKEKTATAPIKMLFPIAVCILPSLLIVIAAPALLRITGGY